LENEVMEAEIDGEVVKRDKAQIAINVARKKGKSTRPKTNKDGQTTLREFSKKVKK
jgi:hypothetical protein